MNVGFFGIFVAIALVLGVWSVSHWVSEIQTCDGAVVETTNPADPYACLPTAP